jgi:hypothetical protein
MKSFLLLAIICVLSIQAMAQVDTSFVYNTSTPYGTLDIRIAKSATRYYYLQENTTFSFRESSPGVRTGTYIDMTSWDSSPYMQGNLREKNGAQDAFVMNYRLLPPVNYNKSYNPGYPLIVMSHGAGERANCWDNSCYWSDRNWKPQTNSPAAPTDPSSQLMNNDNNLLHGGEIHLNARNLAGGKLPNDPTLDPRAFPGFVLFPQNLNGWDANGVQDMIRMVRLVAKKYNIDPNRIYIHGLSNGGYGIYEALKRAPWLFSAALPMSAINDAQITSTNYASVLSEASNIPLWIFQGGIDTDPLPSKTHSYVKKFQDAGFSVRYYEYSNLGHGTWNTAYNEPDFFTWILAKNKANIHAFADIAAICTTTGKGVTLQLSNGFLAYQWEKDGAIIAGANSSTYVANSPGVYRARFSRLSKTPTETQWNNWSDPVTVTTSSPAQAQMDQIGSVLLKDLNFYNDAPMVAKGSFPHYYWYKDDVLIDLPGNEDDTTQHPIFKAGNCTNGPTCVGNGKYTLVTAGLDKCPSPPSEPKYVYFNNQAPVNISAPTLFTGSSSSPSGSSLQWNDVSNNELGFEIWRRKITGSGTFSKWSMASLTAPNATTFTDSGLEPSSTYQYKIRAAGTMGRSDYTPSSTNQFLSITTQADNIPPSAPQNLTATSTGIKEITLAWQASSDNTGIRNYMVFFNSDTVQTSRPATSFTLTNLDLNAVYQFTVKAVDLGYNLSDASNSASANTYVNGLYYRHSTGAWTDLDQIDWTIAEYKGKVSNFTLNPRTQEDYFNFQFQGYLNINIPGSYQFRTTSDDGSRLTLNNNIIVDNDGLHGNVTVTSSPQTLTNGPQFIDVKFFEYTGGQTLIVQYKGPDTRNNWINIPDAALQSGTPPSPGLAARQNTKAKSADDVMVNIYPNPSTPEQSLNLLMVGVNNETVHVRITNMMGDIFYNGSFKAAELQGGTEVRPHKALVKGVYIFTVKDGENVIKQRLMVKE